VDESEFHANWRMLQSILEQADRKLTATEILERWKGAPVPTERTILRRLSRASNSGQRSGQLFSHLSPVPWARFLRFVWHEAERRDLIGTGVAN
jgi:hypothetical protein